MNPSFLFHFDGLSQVMISLLSFVSLSILSFSFRYLKGNKDKGSFYLNLILFIFSTFIMVSADHVALLALSWITTYYHLSKLMAHKRDWKAARQSALIFLRSFGLGFIFLLIALFILCLETQESSISLILAKPIKTSSAQIASLSLLFSIMIQSALWPFHKWLTSSLNSPTPVSAIMHAGAINGGGFILARFAPLLLKSNEILNLIFLVGMITAVIGTAWKLIQSDIKRTLACSTLAQMGFMVAQCGLGLFPVAVAHLCWHGLYKAFLFLSSSSATQDKRYQSEKPTSLSKLFTSGAMGFIGIFSFSHTSTINISTLDSNLFLVLLAFITTVQFALTLLRSRYRPKFLITLITTPILGALYGLSVYFMERQLSGLNISEPQPFNLFYFLGFIVLFLGWLTLAFDLHKRSRYPKWVLQLYVSLLNQSQPHTKTITANRSDYQY